MGFSTILDVRTTHNTNAMKIELPPHKKTHNTQCTDDLHAITVIGANGSGKSRFGDEIARRQGNKVFRISALKALFITPDTEKHIGKNISDIYREQSEKSSYRIENIDTEFEQLMYLLLYEEFVNILTYKSSDGNKSKNKLGKLPRTKLDRVQHMWETIFPQNKMLRIAGNLRITAGNDPKHYSPMRLSDGEKTVFYLLASVLFAESKSIILVEDPEVFLHRSIMKSVWNTVEQLRPDCTFIYLTHDLEFAASRNESTCIWVKSFDSDSCTWEYEIIKNPSDLPEDVYLDLLGSRKPILFIEGTDTRSIDVRLYTLLYPEYTIKPLGGCSKVIETTRTFSDLKGFHHIESHGIVDRDRRTDREVESLRERNISVPEVAEIENLLLIEPVIRTVARRMGQNENNIFGTIRSNIINMFDDELEMQALLHTRHRTKRELECIIDRRSSDIDDYEDHIRNLTKECNPRKLYLELCQEFRSYVTGRKYSRILRVYNQKAMLPNCGIVQLCGFANKDKYIKFIISLLRENKEEARIIRQAMREVVGLK